MPKNNKGPLLKKQQFAQWKPKRCCRHPPQPKMVTQSQVTVPHGRGHSAEGAAHIPAATLLSWRWHNSPSWECKHIFPANLQIPTSPASCMGKPVPTSAHQLLMCPLPS